MLQADLGEAGLATSAVWQAIEAQTAQLTDRGLRVLLIAHHPDPKLLNDQGDDSRLPETMQPIGLISLNDELRAEAQETLQRFIAAGVRPKIISGDNPETVAALAKQAGLPADIMLVSGLELNEMNDAQFAEAAQLATIFGRITPQQKEKLVEALRQEGNYVAMIGDGVNDVLSLKKSNLGIAMESGTQATRAVADIILMKDSFAALAPAVSEGQRIVNGMQDILRLFLTRILSMALLIVSSLVVALIRTEKSPSPILSASSDTCWMCCAIPKPWFAPRLNVLRINISRVPGRKSAWSLAGFCSPIGHRYHRLPI